MRIDTKAFKVRKTRLYQLSKLDKDDAKQWWANRVMGTKTKVYMPDFPESKHYVKALRDISQLKGCLRSSYEMAFHTPKTKAHDWIGIEIECYLPQDGFDGSSGGECDGTCRDNCECMMCGDCGQHDDNRECDCECNDSCGGNSDGYLESVKKSLKRESIKYIDVSDDGSLRPDGDSFGCEIKIMINLSNPKPLERLCAWLARNGATIDKHCGLHVHLDRGFLTENQRGILTENMQAILPVLTKLVSPSRLDNTYCRIRVSDEKYSAVHLLNKTVEVRLHNGTTHYEKIYNWCLLLQAVKAKSIAGDYLYHSKTRMSKFLGAHLGLSEECTAFLLARQAKFNSIDTDDTAIDGSEESAA